VIQALAKNHFQLCSAAAPISSSRNLNDVKGEPNFSADDAGGTCASASARQPWAALHNGLAYTAGSIPYVGTFLNFSDYMRGSVRLGGRFPALT
jgi:transketolase